MMLIAKFEEARDQRHAEEYMTARREERDAIIASELENQSD